VLRQTETEEERRTERDREGEQRETEKYCNTRAWRTSIAVPKSTDTRRNIIDVSVKTRPGSFGTCAPTARAKKDCERLVQLADQDLCLRSVRIIQAKNSACNALGASSSSGGSRSPISGRSPSRQQLRDAVRRCDEAEGSARRKDRLDLLMP
jgi:hypothetical protein